MQLFQAPPPLSLLFIEILTHNAVTETAAATEMGDWYAVSRI